MAVNNHRCFGFASGFGSKPKYNRPSSGLHLLNYQLSKIVFFVSLLLQKHLQTSAFDPWCFHKPSWTEPVEASASICCGPPSWLIPEICGEAGGRGDRWLPTYLYDCLLVCVCLSVHWDWCKCAVLIPVNAYVGVSVPALAFNCVFRRWYNILFCEKWKALN